MNERQAWKACKIMHGERAGLCAAISDLWREGLITKATWGAMKGKINKALGGAVYLQPWPKGVYTDHRRRTFAADRIRALPSRAARPLTEAQAWRLVQVFFGIRDGLCITVSAMYGQRLISLALRNRMKDTLRAAAGKDGYGCAYMHPVPKHVETDLVREAFARNAVDQAEKAARRRRKAATPKLRKAA